MPKFNIAQYADCRIEYALKADNLEHVKALLEDGTWETEADILDVEIIDKQELCDDIDGNPVCEEITPDSYYHDKAWAAELERTRRQSGRPTGNFPETDFTKFDGFEISGVGQIKDPARGRPHPRSSYVPEDGEFIEAQ